MAIDVTFYQFNKNDNSTKIPTAGGTVIPCNMIEPTSAVNPSIALVLEGNPVGYNYARIEAFNRYYFVNDWTYDRGRWVASLNCDVLASFKAEIGASTQYVLRSSDEYDGDVPDRLYPTANIPTVTRILSGETVLTPFLASGFYVVGIINNSENAVGCVSYYKFTNAQFRAFCAFLLGDPEWAYSGIAEIGTNLFKSLFNPFQYVVSCQWFPLTSGGSGTAVEAIPYGWWSVPTAATLLNGEGGLEARVDVTYSIPDHPQLSRGNYLQGAPYSRYTLSWPAFGTFPLDANLVAKARKVKAWLWIDLVSGGGVLSVFNDTTEGGDYATLAVAQVHVGVPIQLAQQASNFVGGAFQIASGIGQIQTGGLSGGASAIMDGIESVFPQTSSRGQNGMTTGYHWQPALDCEFYELVAENNAHRGRPLCQNRVISAIPGYVMCSDAELEISGTAQELESVKTYLNGGFYYE